MFKHTLATIVALAMTHVAAGQQYFHATDGTVDFSKAAFADSSDSANWDTITSAVAITRGNTQGIFNPIGESSYDSATSPLGTLWFFGGTAQDVQDGTVNQADFANWQTAHSMNPPSTVGVDGILYLIDDDAYVDIRFTQWGVGGGAGGSFSYTRAIVPTPGSAVILGASALFVTRRRRC